MPFHINPSTGDAGACRAKAGNCPFGGSEEHYGTAAEARTAFEGSTHAPPKKLSKTKLGDNAYLKPEHVSRIPPYGVLCPSCEGRASIDQVNELIGNDWVWCECGERYDLVDAKIRVEPGTESHRFIDPKEVTKAVWYHATAQEDWLEKGDPFQVHVGLEAAAFDRALSILAPHSASAKPFYLYEVSLDADATVDSEISAEGENYEISGAGDGDVIRYVNRYEAPGTVSLLLNSSKLKVTGKRLVQPEEAHEYLSVYNVTPN